MSVFVGLHCTLRSKPVLFTPGNKCVFIMENGFTATPLLQQCGVLGKWGCGGLSSGFVQL